MRFMPIFPIKQKKIFFEKLKKNTVEGREKKADWLGTWGHDE